MNTTPEIEKLFHQFYEPLHRYAFTILKNDEDAKDVVQSVFLTLIEKERIISIATSARSYLYKMVHNSSINFLKKTEMINRHHHQLAAVDHEPVVPACFAEEERQDMEIRINEILDRMPPQCRIVFMKSRADQKKYKEIAAELNISVKTVEVHMTKALKIIRGIAGVLLWLVCL